MNKNTLLVVGALALVGCKQGSSPSGDAAEAGTPAPTVALPPLESGHVEGTLTIAGELKSEVKLGDAIYVMARNAATGSLIAAARLVASDAATMPFRLTSQNVMHSNVALAGRVRLEARVDKDGDAMTREPGDLVGELDQPVTVPASGVRLTVNRKL